MKRAWGSIDRRAGRWTVRYRDPATGKRVRKTLPASVPEHLTSAQKEDVLAELRKRVDRGGPATLARFLERHAPVYRSRVAPSTAFNVLNMAGKLAEELGDLPMASVDRSFAGEFLARLKKTGLSGRGPLSDHTLRHYRAILRMFWRAATEEKGGPVSNPWGVPLARGHARPVPALAVSECDRLVAAMPPVHAPLVRFLLETGLRIGEAMALCWDDVQGGAVSVRKSKTGRPRVVPLTDAARAVLAGIPRRRGIGQANRIFRDRLRYSVFHRACAKAGLARLRIHDLRHIFAVRCARAGVPLLHLSKILGHSTIAMTQRYADHEPDALAAAGIARLEAHERSASSTAAPASNA